MACGSNTGWRRFVVARFSTSVTLALCCLSWGCRDSHELTAVSRLAPGQGHVLSSAAPESEVIPGQYIITFADSVSDVPGLARRIAAQYGNEPLFTYTAAIKGFAVQLPDQALEGLAHNPQIERIEADAIVHSTDTQLSAVWNLDRLDQRLRPLDGSYSYSTNGAGVNVYIIDSGLRTTHTEFGGRAVSGYTAVNDGRGTNDCTGHGTHVGGTVGGTKYGVAKGVKLYAVRVFDCNGSGAWSAVLSALDWVTKNRVLPAVANLSIEGARNTTVNAAVVGMINAGVVAVIAAGNDASDACNYTPASTTEGLTVGSSWNFDGMSGFSNYGSCVDLFAPGEAIRSAYFVDDTSSVLKGGTSMASPHVAGVAALYLSAFPTATPAQVSSAILGNATPNILTSVPAGTANLLVYANFSQASPPPPTDTTTPPPPTDTTTKPPIVDQPPVASFTSSCPHGKCAFDASSSTDDHGITQYGWTFGDGSTQTAGSNLVKVSHAYTSAGSYTVTLTVTDAAGHSVSKSVTLSFKKL